ncbi:MAG: hypothetical protein WC364_11030 [Eubacteriales bacterium]|jgi:hypothetical protein
MQIIFKNIEGVGYPELHRIEERFGDRVERIFRQDDIYDSAKKIADFAGNEFGSLLIVELNEYRYRGDVGVLNCLDEIQLAAVNVVGECFAERQKNMADIINNATKKDARIIGGGPLAGPGNSRNIKLNVASLSIALETIANQKDTTGQSLGLVGDLLIVSQYDKELAYQAVEQLKRPFDIIVIPSLRAGTWVVIDSVYARKAGLVQANRTPLRIRYEHPFVFGRIRYALGVLDPRCLFIGIGG